MDNDWFFEIDAKGKTLDEIDPHQYSQYPAVQINNLTNISRDSFVEFSLQYGDYLPYGDDDPILVFGASGHLLGGIDWHYDGISADDKRKVPEWLFFWANQPPATSCGGEFRIAHGGRALELIPEDIVQYLKTHPLEFYGYYPEQVAAEKFDEYSFEILPVSEYNGQDVLRVCMPHVETSFYDARKVFRGKTQEESMEIFSVIRAALENEKVSKRLFLKADQVLFINNQIMFHGRAAFTKQVDRQMSRIQILEQGILRTEFA